MRGSRAFAASAAVVLSCVGVSCGSNSADDDDDDAGRGGQLPLTGGTGGSGGSGNLGGNAMGGSSMAGAISVGIGGTGGSAGSTAICAGEVTNAMQVPLDIYVILDSSGSMLEQTADGNTKWDAVTSALATFLADPQSEGIGVGLQFFPLRHPDVPNACDTDADCGTFGPCFQRFCENAGPDIYACATSEECRTSAGEDVGPCSPIKYCWSFATSDAPELVLCHDDSECSGEVDDCVPFNQCSLDNEYACRVAGANCGASLGTCEPYNPTSFCVHQSDCRSGVYALPEVEIAALPAAAAGLESAIVTHEPSGDTPTSAALAGAIEHAAAHAIANPTHRVIVLLATDGLPTECIEDAAADPSGVEGVRAIAEAGAQASPSIETYVIGVFAPTDSGARENLTSIAQAGGSETAFIVDTTSNVEQDFLMALDAIRGTGLACEFQIPAPEAGNTLDYGQVNVEFSSQGNLQTLYYWPDASACDPTTGGWYYDIPPSAGTPTKIIACPASCDLFEAASDGSVEIRLGCQTLVR